MAIQAPGRGERHQKASGNARSDRELREANRPMHEFLDLLGHELRSPLAAIRNGLRILKQQGDDAATREWVRSLIKRQTQAIGRLVEDLLQVSCIEHGKIPLRKQSLDLAQSVARAVEMVRACADGRGHHLELALPAVACGPGCGSRPAGAGADTLSVASGLRTGSFIVPSRKPRLAFPRPWLVKRRPVWKSSPRRRSICCVTKQWGGCGMTVAG